MRGPREPDDGDDLFSLIGRPVPVGLTVRMVSIPAGGELEYDAAAWAGAIIVVERGEIELEWRGGTRGRFAAGSILFFEGLGLRAVCNRTRQPALLLAASRRHSPAEPEAATAANAVDADVAAPGGASERGRGARGSAWC
jgi:hypothetical protein